MENRDFIVEKDGKQFVDVVRLLPDRTSEIREIIKEIERDKVTIYSKIRARGKGKGSKKVTVCKLIELDELFFEGLGLWQAEGGKTKGLYFGNTCVDILERFLEFVESKLDISRNDFKAHLILPKIDKFAEETKKRWSDLLKIPIVNFTKISIKSKTNLEYAHLYFNSEILVSLMRLFYGELKSIILMNDKFAAAFMRGVIAGESQVATKSWGTLSHVSISSKSLDDVTFYKQCFQCLGIMSGGYQYGPMTFPIYGKGNFDEMVKSRLMDLHPDKKSKFENGIASYKRIITDFKETEKLILQQLAEPKTYDELAKLLRKGRSTVQSSYIPRLEKKGLISRIGKRRQAWLFQASYYSSLARFSISSSKSNFLTSSM